MQELFIDHAVDGTRKRTPNSRPEIKWGSNGLQLFCYCLLICCGRSRFRACRECRSNLSNLLSAVTQDYINSMSSSFVVRISG